jgi:hypothetical protein
MRSLYVEATSWGTVSIVTVQLKELNRDAGVIVPADELTLLLGSSHDKSWGIVLQYFVTCCANPVVCEIREVFTSC